MWQEMDKEIDIDSLGKLEELSKSLIHSSPYEEKTSVSIRHIALNVAERCNLRCTYCYAGEGDYGNDSLMSFDVACKAIRFFSKKDKPLHIAFFGGEPLLNFELIKNVVEWCKTEESAYSFSLTTNAVLLNPQHMDFFTKNKFAIKVSYDGKSLQSVQRTHNTQLTGRIENKLQKFEADLLKLRSFQLRSTISRAHIDSFAINLLNTLNSFQYRIQYARVSSNHKRELFTLEDAKKLSALLEEVVEHWIDEKDWNTLLRIGNFKSMIRKLHYGQEEPFCGAGINYLSVSTRGRFYLCHRFTEDEEECFGDVENGINEEKFRYIQSLRGRLKEPCSSCWMRNLCQGGCFHEHKMARGHIANIDPVFCYLQDKEMKLALKAYVSLNTHAPDLLSEFVK